MSLRPDLLASLPDFVAQRIHAELPALRECEGMVGGFDLDELKRAGIAAPAIRVTILGIRPKGAEAGPHRRWSVNMAAFIMTKDTMGLKRDSAALTITQTLLGLIPDANWSEPGVGPAEGVEARVIVGRAAREIAFHLSAVNWVQPVTFAALDTSTPMPIEMYVGGQPL